MLFCEENIAEEHFLLLVKYLINLIHYNMSYEQFKRLINSCINKSIKLCNFNLIKFLIEYYNINFGILTDIMYIEKLVINNKLEIIEYLLQNVKFIINTTLKLAIKHNNIEIVKYLIEKGANINSYSLIDASTNCNLQMVKILIENNIDFNRFGYDSIKRCHDLNIIKYIINNFNEINYDTLYEKVVDVNFEVAKYLENNYNININLLLSKTGNINIIKKYIDDYVLLEKLNNNLLEYNSEDDCILFFEDIVISNKILKYLNNENYEKFLDYCIMKSYLKLLIFMINNFKKYEIKNICDIIEYSKCEDDVLYFIDNISYFEKNELNLSKIIINSINKKYLKLNFYTTNKFLMKILNYF